MNRKLCNNKCEEKNLCLKDSCNECLVDCLYEMALIRPFEFGEEDLALRYFARILKEREGR